MREKAKVHELQRERMVSSAQKRAAAADERVLSTTGEEVERAGPFSRGNGLEPFAVCLPVARAGGRGA